MKLDFIDTLLTEDAAGGARIPHPEDAIFSGLPEAQKYLAGIKEVIANPQTNTVKWDGFIALFFGYAPTGEFFINDKYMPEGFFAKSAADWERYDTQIKASKNPRTDLYPKLDAIWEGLRVSVTAKAIFKGDLMAIGDDMVPKGGKYVFKGVTVTYKIPTNSPAGIAMEDKAGMIVVHSMNGTPWDGVTGLANKGNVAILGPMGLPAGQKAAPFKLNEPTKLLKSADATLKTSGPEAEKFLMGLDGVSRAKIQTYFNKKITKQTNAVLDAWLKDPASNTKPPTLKKLAGYIDPKTGEPVTGYLENNKAGFDALAKVWNSMYELKNNLAGQLEKQVKGFTQEVNGQPQGEGFVANTPSAGIVKLVNRGVFGGAHFN